MQKLENNINFLIKENYDNIDKSSKILFLGSKYQQNAIFLSKNGLHVEVLDSKDTSLMRLQKEAQKEDTAITIRHTLLEHWEPAHEYGAIISFFTDIPKIFCKDIFKKIVFSLKDDGVFIAEFFSKKNQEDTNGYEIDELYKIFKQLPCKIYKLSLEITTTKKEKKEFEVSVIRLVLKKV